MQRRMKALLGIATAFAVAATMAGCSNSSSGGSSTGGPSTGKLVVWDLLSGSDPAWKKVMQASDAAFEKAHPGVTIDRVAQPADPTVIHQLMQAAAQAKKGPDLIMIWPWGDVQTLKPSLAPIENYLPADTQKDLSGWDGVNFDGHTYGVPIGLQGNGITLNRSLFKKAGLDPDSPPDSVSSLIDACTALRKVGVTPITGGNKEGYLSGWMYSMLWPGYATQKDATAALKYDLPLTGTASTGAANAIMQLVAAKCFDPNMPATPWYPDGFQEFMDGKAAMSFSIYSQLKGFGTTPAISGTNGDNLSFISTVAGEHKATFLPAGAMNVWSVTKFSPRPKLATELAAFTESATNQEQRLNTDGYFPNNSKVSFDKFIAANPIATNLVDSLKGGATTVIAGHQMQDSKTNEIFQNQIELTMLGQSTVKDALAAAEQSRLSQRPLIVK